MQQRIESRISELQQELSTGRDKLRELDARSVEVRSQMLRINGAIQVLEELLVDKPTAADTPDPMLRTVNR